MLTQRLRHRVDIQAQVNAQDPLTGAVELVWVDVLLDEPAEVVPLSGREYIQANTTQVEISARVTIRWRSGLDPAMRIVFDGMLYQIHAILPDPSARKWLTILVRALEPFGDQGVEELDGGDAITEPEAEFFGGGA